MYNSGDANDFNFGYYRYTNAVSNIPSSYDGQIVAYSLLDDTENRPIIQLASDQIGTFYKRSKWYTGNWTSWSRLD